MRNQIWSENSSSNQHYKRKAEAQSRKKRLLISFYIASRPRNYATSSNLEDCYTSISGGEPKGGSPVLPRQMGGFDLNNDFSLKDLAHVKTRVSDFVLRGTVYKM